MGSAFADCGVLFTGAGVLHLLRDQQQSFTAAWGALPDYGVTNIFCCQASLLERGLAPEQLMLDLALLSGPEIHALIGRYDQTLCL